MHACSNQVWATVRYARDIIHWLHEVKQACILFLIAHSCTAVSDMVKKLAQRIGRAHLFPVLGLLEYTEDTACGDKI